MQQPSAQGIASLYRGNPQPLQQSIQKDQQAKPGLPPDLQKLLALQIVTNEKDSVTAQKAMDQLQQMGGQQGQPPTVMQSLQQQAQQKIQAQQQQARQQAEQRGLPAGLMGVQGEPPQPEAQPEAQGIDQLPAEFQMAEGGIVAFNGEERSDVPKAEEEESGLEKYATVPAIAAAIGVPVAVYRQAADLAARMGTSVGEVLKTMGKDITRAGVSGAKNVVKTAATSPAGAILAGGVPATQFAGDVIRSASPEQREGFYDSPMMGAMSGDAGLAAAIMNASKPVQDARKATLAAEKPAPKYSPEIQSSAETTKLQRQTSLPQGPEKDTSVNVRREAAPVQERPSSVNDIVALAKKMQASQPTAAPAAADSAAKQLVTSRMSASPEEREAADIAKYEKMVGAPDTTQHDRLIAELEKRKQTLEPKQGYEGLMEYLSQISANSQPGRGSFASGAAGARGMDKLNKERQLEQFELSKQAIEVSQKKLDTVRAFSEKKYGVGKASFDQVYKDNYDAAKELLKDENEASKVAKQETLKYFELAQNQLLEQQRIRAQAANRPFDLQGEYAKAMLAGDKQKAATLLNAINNIGEAKKPGADTAQVAKFRADFGMEIILIGNLQRKQAKGELKPAEQAQLQKLEENLARTAKSQGIDPAQVGIAGGSASGKVPPPPPGFKMN